jgi:simple sugar transport system ATP-binding protein
MSAVELKNISVSFGKVQALEDVDFDVQSGEIHALVGENGAGKTTLMRVLYGAQRMDSGSVVLDGNEAKLRDSADAIRHGIGMVSQHYAIIPEISCLENLILGAEPNPLLKKSQLARRADELASSMGFEFDWHKPAETLSPAGKQKLEILKLIWRESKILILDEPTAMLSPQDADALFQNLTRLAKEGAAVVVVTHRLPEVMDYCHRVTVLRGGRKVMTQAVEQTDDRSLAEAIMGHVVEPAPTREDVKIGPPLLRAEGLKVKGERGDYAVDNASFELRTGELLGIAGVDGNGQRELIHALMGLAPVAGGRLYMGEERAPGSVADRLRWGLRLIPEDRHAEGVVEDWSLEQNAALGRQGRKPFARGGRIDRAGRRAEAQRIAERFQTKFATLGSPMRSLSGGNQQRFVAARALLEGGRVILAFQPTRGLDIDGARDVYAAIRQACESGMAALVVSFDLDDLLQYADRILVMSRGSLVEPSPGSARDRQAIGRLMVGAH